MGRINTRLSILVAAGLLLAAEVMAATVSVPWRPRKRQTEEGLRPGVSAHELKDIQRWPAEPASPPVPPDPARFRAALSAMCEGAAAPPYVVGRMADQILKAGAEAEVDPFLLATLVYRASRCDPRLRTPFGIGLLQIQPSMYAGNVRGTRLLYQVREGEGWAEKSRPLPRGALYPVLLTQAQHNLRVGAALLGMWQDQHPAIDEAFPESVPHRTLIAHWGWGDLVRGTSGEDRVLVARRRFIEQYLGQRPTPRMSSLGFPVVSPLGGTPRVAPSGPGEDRDDGARAHRGLDLDATTGEPVGSLADGVVTFTGFDLPGRVPPQAVPAGALRRTRRPRLGPGGLFVCVRHTETVASCYMHLSSYRVQVNDRVKAGDRLGSVGRSGVRASGCHLHLQIHVKGVPIDPAPVLGPELAIPPQDTVAHDLAVKAKKLRLRRERHARWLAHLAARKDAAARPK